MLDSRIDNELAELKRSQAASLDAFKAELRGEVGNQIWKYIRHIDETKVDVEGLRSKIKEIVNYEGHSLQWLINCIRSIANGIAAPGCNNSILLNLGTPQPPAQLKSDPIDPRLPQHPLPQNPRDAFLGTSNASSYAAAAAKK